MSEPVWFHTPNHIKTLVSELRTENERLKQEVKYAEKALENKHNPASALVEVERLNGEARGYNSMLETLTVNNSKLHAENERLKRLVYLLSEGELEYEQRLAKLEAENERLKYKADKWDRHIQAGIRQEIADERR